MRRRKADALVERIPSETEAVVFDVSREVSACGAGV